MYLEYLCNSVVLGETKLKLLFSVSKEIYIVFYETNYLELPQWKAYTMETRFGDFSSPLWFEKSEFHCICFAQY